MTRRPSPSLPEPPEVWHERLATPTSTIEGRVASARSACDSAIDNRARELAQAAIDDYFSDKIDETELNRRKRAARKEASAELSAMDVAALQKAHGAYEAAKAARLAAEQALATAELALTTAVDFEAEAATRVDEVLRVIEHRG